MSTNDRAERRRLRPVLLAALAALTLGDTAAAQIGREVAVERHLADGEEHSLRTRDLIDHGELLFGAMWTRQEAAGSDAFLAGNTRFLTRKLWGVASEPPYFYHGKFTTLREAVEAHRGEAQESNDTWNALGDYERDSVIEFLKSLQVLSAGTRHRVVDERGRPRHRPPRGHRERRG